MKTRVESASKPKINRSAQHAHELRELRSSSDSGECPREQMIAEAAYFRAERRGFEPGNEMSDWLQAEADVEACRESIQ